MCGVFSNPFVNSGNRSFGPFSTGATLVDPLRVVQQSDDFAAEMILLPRMLWSEGFEPNQ